MQNDNFQNTPFQHAIVLTGGIATGKSTTASLFMMHGFLIIDADSIAHTILNEQSDTIASLFGDEYLENGIVNRKKLGELIFNNLQEKTKLENFIHPLIKEEIISQATIFEKQKKPYLIDIPLFFERQNYPIEKSIVVYAPKELQIQRLMARDKCDQQTALSRIDNQMDIEEKRKLASYIIDNTKDLKHLQKEVERIKKEIL